MQCIKIILFFLFTTSWAFSQQDSLTVQYDDSKLEEHQITKDDLKKYKDSKDFNYSEVVQEESFLNKIVLWFRNMAKKIFDAATGKYGFLPDDIFFDTTVFPLAIDMPMGSRFCTSVLDTAAFITARTAA